MKLNWGYSIILFFIVFISLMIGFVVFSLRQNNDLVTEDYYEKGADFTHQMDINHRSLGFRDSINLAGKNGLIHVHFAKSICQMADSMHIYFYRPSDRKLDFRMNTLLRTDSLIIDEKNLANGRYTVTFEWLAGKDRYEIEKDYFNVQ